MKIAIIDPVAPIRTLIKIQVAEIFGKPELFEFETLDEANLQCDLDSVVFVHLQRHRTEVLDYIRNLRSLDHNWKLTIVGYGESSERAYIDSVNSAGFDFYVVKPFSVRDALLKAKSVASAKLIESPNPLKLA